MDQVYLTTQEAANYIGLSESYLSKLRMDANIASGPRFLRVGARVVRYAKVDLDHWMNAEARSV